MNSKNDLLLKRPTASSRPSDRQAFYVTGLTIIFVTAVDTTAVCRLPGCLFLDSVSVTIITRIAARMLSPYGPTNLAEACTGLLPTTHRVKNRKICIETIHIRHLSALKTRYSAS
jgi:hypothetical protein